MADLFVLDLPWARPPLSHNQRRHWRALAREVALIRRDVHIVARRAGVPALGTVTVQLHYAPGDRRRRDPMNFTASSKPAIDALVDAGVVPDDDAAHVHELTPRIHPPPTEGPRCWLTIRPGLPTEPIHDEGAP